MACGVGVGGNVDCSAERHMNQNDTMVTSGGELRDASVFALA